MPLNAARDIAEAHGYDQVIIIARKAGEDGGQHINTFGTVKSRHMVMAMTGEFSEAALREIANKADDPRHVAYEEACIAKAALAGSALDRGDEHG